VNAKRFPATIVAVLFVSSILQYPVTHPARGLSFSEAEAAESWRFRLEEATIDDVHRALRAQQLTATQFVTLYLQRIKTYNGTCVQGALDSATGLQLGDITPMANAGQLNAFITLNLKDDKRISLGFAEKTRRTHTGPDDPKVPDALDRARELDAYFPESGGLPAIVVPAGFTKEVYDREPDDKDPNGSKLVGPKPVELPVAVEFLGRPFEEAKLVEIASGFEKIRRQRRPPSGFGKLSGEP